MTEAAASLWDRFGPALIAGMLSGGIAWGTISADIRAIERRVVVVETYVDQDRNAGAAFNREFAEFRAEQRAENRAIRQLLERLTTPGRN